MRKFPGVLVAVLVATSLILAACAGASPTAGEPSEPESEAPSSESAAPSVEPIDFKACMVSDVGGFDDNSFNENGLQGLERAREELGVEIATLQSDSEEDYDRNINQFISDGCDMIITVGFLLGDATKEAAEANPDVRFAIVDFAYDPPIPNVEGLVYNTAQAAMLAGYAAASWSKTDIMGTFGGINIGPGVTDFMDGFIAGMNYWNEQKGESVRMLGGRDPLDPASGTFTGDFTSTDNAKNVTIGFLQEGADVILPVGGPIGQGTFAAIREQNADAVGLGVDVDWTQTVPEYADLMLVSIIKRIDNSVFQAIERAVNGEPPEAVFLSDLANEGVGISPFHEYEDEISDEVKAEIEELRQAIIDGEIEPSDYYSVE
ncbi:MAG TPA: BMP family ABC transporter substrate-binding protein [candidate division Zixibacteria bacterium]|nr:BMP family ABC transporter substrate-binding protein [candidate division Zixibacteria bacterium]